MPTIDLTIDTGSVIRFAFLMTHYRSPCEMGPDKLDQARKALRRLAMACEPCFDGPPTEVINTLANDINTPGVIALMHQYRAQKQGKKLFATLRFMGFWGSLCLPDEIKTLPEDHIWNVQNIGLDAVGSA